MLQRHLQPALLLLLAGRFAWIARAPLPALLLLPHHPRPLPHHPQRPPRQPFRCRPDCRSARRRCRLAAVAPMTRATRKWTTAATIPRRIRLASCQPIAPSAAALAQLVRHFVCSTLASTRISLAAARDNTLAMQRHVIRPGGGQNILVKVRFLRALPFYSPRPCPCFSPGQLYDQYAKDDHNQSVFKVGQLVEVIGVLSVTTPWIEGSADERSASSDVNCVSAQLFALRCSDEMGDYNPPMSRVLRLHCMHMRSLNQGFPLAPVISTPIFEQGLRRCCRTVSG